MSSDDEAQDAIRGLNNKELEGRPMSVSVARPKEDRRNSFSEGKRRW
jgi:RNA recognition motif-containing protein